MKFLVDECIGKRFNELMKREGFNSIFVGDCCRGAKDAVVIDQANKENRVIITEDKDFGELIFKRKLHVPGIILFRTKTTNPNLRINLIRKLLSKIDPYGKFIVISEKYIKIRELKGIY